MQDLGTTRPKTGDMPMPANPVGGEERPQYPNLEFNGQQAQKAGVGKCSIGDEYEMKIRIKAVRLGGYGEDDDLPPAQFQVIAADAPTKVESEGDDEEEEEKSTEPPPKRRILSPSDIKKAKPAYRGDND